MARARPRQEKESGVDDSTKVTPGKVPAFLRGCILKGYARVKLYHLTEEGQQVVGGWSLTGDEEDEQSADTLAQELVTEAQEDAHALGGHQRYLIMAFDKAGQAAARKTFEVTSMAEAGEDSSPAENASPKGLLSQLMRHIENRERTATNQFGDVLFYMQGIIKSQGEELQSYRTHEVDRMKAHEELISQAHARRLAEAREARHEEMQGKFFEIASRLAPIAIAKLLPVSGGAKTEKVLGHEELLAMVEALMSDPVLAQGLLGKLGPIKSAQLVEVGKKLKAGVAPSEKGLVEDMIASTLADLANDGDLLNAIVGSLGPAKCEPLFRAIRLYAEREQKAEAAKNGRSKEVPS